MRFYRFFLIKAYFDKGFGFLSYAKYIITLLGASSMLAGNTKMMLAIMIGYGILCFIIGFIMYHFRLVETEYEIGNRYNLFVQEMRGALKKKTFK